MRPHYQHQNHVLSKHQSLALLKKERRIFYDSIGSIECPILSDTVYFTAQGFDHLINESNSTQGDSNARKPTEQYMKLMHLEYVPHVIENCAALAEIRPVNKKEKGKWKKGFQYELICDVPGKGKVSVIVEKIGNGKHKFLSVFPWAKHSRNKRRLGKRRP